MPRRNAAAASVAAAGRSGPERSGRKRRLVVPAFSDPLPPGPPPRDAALVARTPMDNSDAAGPPVEPTSGVLRSGLKTFFSSPTVQLAGNVVAALLGFACDSIAFTASSAVVPAPLVEKFGHGEAVDPSRGH